jgi:hypothetical protein
MGVFIAKSIFNEFQFHEDRDLAGSEDYELWIRIYAKYGVAINPIVSSAMICHNERSEYLIESNKLIKRIKLLNSLINQNALLSQKHKQQIVSNVLLYQSITFVEAKVPGEAVKSAFEAIRVDSRVLSSYKTYATIYHIIKLFILRF